MFSCNFHEIFINTFFVEALGATASEFSSQAVSEFYNIFKKD